MNSVELWSLNLKTSDETSQRPQSKSSCDLPDLPDLPAEEPSLKDELESQLASSIATKPSRHLKKKINLDQELKREMNVFDSTG